MQSAVISLVQADQDLMSITFQCQSLGCRNELKQGGIRIA